MEKDELICKACGYTSFATGQLGHGRFTTDGNIRPLASLLATGSPLIFFVKIVVK